MRKKRGRPIPEGGRRDQVFPIRINEEERRQIDALAEKFGVSHAEVIRRSVGKAFETSFEGD